MDFRPLNDTERRQLINALRGNAESDRAILMDRRDTSFLAYKDISRYIRLFLSNPIWDKPPGPLCQSFCVSSHSFLLHYSFVCGIVEIPIDNHHVLFVAL
jgi:hypothetical protein